MFGEKTLQLRLDRRSKTTGKFASGAFALALVLAAVSLVLPLLGPKHASLLPFPAIPFNLGILIALGGLSGILARRKFDLAAFTIGLIGSVLGLLLLAESFVHENLGTTDAVLEGGTGRVSSPLLAFGIFVSFTALALFSKGRHSRMLLIGPALAAIGGMGICGISALGDLFDLSLVSEPGTESNLYLLTNAALFLLSTGTLFEVVSSVQADLSAGPRPFAPILSGGALFLLSLFAWVFTSEANVEAARSRVKELSTESSMAVLNFLGSHTKRLRTLAENYPVASEPARAAWAIGATSAGLELADLASLTLLDARGAAVWSATLAKGAQPSPAANARFAESQARLLANAVSTRRAQFSSVLPLARDHMVLLIATPVVAQNAVSHVLLAAIDIPRFLVNMPAPDGFQVEVLESGRPIFTREVADQELAASWAATTHVPSVRVNWNVRTTPTTQKLLDLEGNTASLILGCGLLLSLLVALVLHFRTLSRERGEAASYNERKFEASAALSPLCVFRSTPEGEFLGVNGIWEGITGLDEQESRGDGWRRSVHPEDRDRLESDWKSGLVSGKAFGLSFRLIAKDGQPYPFKGKVEIIEGALKGTTELVGALGIDRPA